MNDFEKAVKELVAHYELIKPHMKMGHCYPYLLDVNNLNVMVVFAADRFEFNAKYSDGSTTHFEDYCKDHVVAIRMGLMALTELD